MDDIAIMRRVIALSRDGVEKGHGGPFGCVVVRNGVVVAEAHNEVLSSKDPTSHAELLAIRRASAELGTYDLSDCDLYTIGSPCCMCMSSMLWARIRRAYYVLPMAESAAIDLGDEEFYAELAKPVEQRTIVPLIHQPALADEARAAYRFWYTKPDRVAF
jgi:guanine deaminase